MGKAATLLQPVGDREDLDPEKHRLHSREQEEERQWTIQAPNGLSRRREGVPMGVVLLDKIINGTQGTLSIDLKRPQVPRDDRARSSLFTVRRGISAPAPGYPSGSYSGGYQQQGGYGAPQRRRWQQQQPVQAVPAAGYVNALPNFAFGTSGARIKAMRHVGFGQKYELTKYGHTTTAPAFDLGVGLDFEFDTAELKPLARLKIFDTISLRALPSPALKVQKRLVLGTSGYGVRLAYECPVEGLTQFYAPPARLSVSIDNAVDTGVRVTQSGLELAANLWLLNGDIRVRGVGMVALPSELPVVEDQMLVGFDVRRLGVKAKW